MEYIVLGCRVLLAVVFLVSAGSKIRSRAAFAEFTASARRLSRVPARLVAPVAAGTVAAELAIVALLIVPGGDGSPARVGFLLAATLLTGLTIAVLAALRRGQAQSCNCFGGATSALGPAHVLRNLLLIAAALTALLAGLTAGPAMAALGAVLTALTALAAAALLIRLDDIAELFRPAQ